MKSFNWPLKIGIFGIDGCGKTTQINLLKGKLKSMGFFVETPQVISGLRTEAHRIALEMGHKSAGDCFDPSGLSFASVLDFYVDVKRIFSSTVEKRIVILDKYRESIIARDLVSYGCTFSDTECILQLYPDLDLVFYIDIDVNVSIERIITRNGFAQGVESSEYLTDYASFYRKNLPKHAILLGGDVLSAELHEVILNNVNEFLE